MTADNVEEYINAVIDAIIGKGAQAQAKAFSEGFSKVFPITDLQAFTADELTMLFGNGDEDWSMESMYPLRPESSRCSSISHSLERGVEG